uniref:L-lactate dehydrogenase (cytochrome) n=1 Tax=Kwoniella dejecticola CBS 10117 TaxID=1296121 RepID=A0A1A6A7R6_9TREE|nr:L-lactate dehydrogenase [Kwoniella dejecticola CBS 10117]OBR86100.1 L-lactate dehydrogenase [Kwoniella dejecticola CBS 10117]
MSSFAPLRKAASNFVRTAPRSFVSRRSTSSQVTSSTRRIDQRLIIGAGVAISVPTYLYLTRARLDYQPDTVPDKVNSDIPDQVRSTQGGGKGQVAKVSSKDVLDKKDSDEFWVVINGDVYNVTEFLDEHPGGREIIESNRSKDVSYIFNPRHPSDQLNAENLPPSVKHLGVLEISSEEEKEELQLKISKSELDEQDLLQKRREEFDEKGLGQIINMRDFEKHAEELCSKVAWGYYASAADDEITKETNNTDYKKIRFRPRVLRPVKEVDSSTKILGYDSTIPLWISPAAMAKLGHPDGEVNLTKGAAATGIIQCISSFASCSVEEIAAARTNNQPLFFQLYVNSKRHLAKEVISKINRLGFNAILLTVDAPVGGKRERDIRVKGEFEAPKSDAYDKQGDTKGVAEAIFSAVDPDLNWKDLKWIREQTDLPIIIKGVQTVEDAVQAYKYGADGVVLSNHGGRQLDTSSTGISTLLEIRKHAPFLLRPEKFSIFVDGGIWRGTDVVKALCLGAEAVGVGRGFLFAQTVGGVDGAIHAVKIFESEIQLAMRLLGANKLSDLRPSMVDVVEN